MRKHEQGNVLFLILIAVALFAALSYAVTQSSRGSGNANKEKTGIVASQIVQAVSDIRVGLQRFMLSRGLAAEDVVFCDNDVSWCDTFGDAAGLCFSGINCLFAPEGGGVTPNFPDGYGFYLYDEREFWRIYGVGTTASEIGLEILTHWSLPMMSFEMCDAINKGFGQATEEQAAGSIAEGLSVEGSYDFCLDINPTVNTNYRYFAVLRAF